MIYKAVATEESKSLDIFWTQDQMVVYCLEQLDYILR